MSKKHQKREKLLCNPQEWRRSSREVGETPGNGEESPSFGEEPVYDTDLPPPDRRSLQQELMRILHDNWPGLLEPFRFQDALELSKTYSDHELHQIRQSHAMTLLQIRKGLVYGMIGGGYASNGYSGEVLRRVDYWHNRCNAFQQVFIENADKIGRILFRDKEYADMRIGLLGISNADDVTVMEKDSGYIIHFNIKDGEGRVYSPQAYFEDITQKGHHNNLVMELAGKSRK